MRFPSLLALSAFSVRIEFSIQEVDLGGLWLGKWNWFEFLDDSSAVHNLLWILKGHMLRENL